jgi:hypothetical protein
MHTLAVLKAFGKQGAIHWKRTPSHWGGGVKYQQMSFGRKNMTRLEIKGENVRE